MQGRPLSGVQLFDPLAVAGLNQSSLGSDKPLGLLFGVAEQMKNVNANIQPLSSLAGGAQDPQHLMQSILSQQPAAPQQAPPAGPNAAAGHV